MVLNSVFLHGQCYVSIFITFLLIELSFGNYIFIMILL